MIKLVQNIFTMELVIPQLMDPMSSLKIRGFASVYRHIRSDEESEHERLCSVLEISNVF